MAQHRAKIHGINAKGAMDRAAIISKNSQEIAEIRNKSWQENQVRSDRMHREVIETIRGVETYDDPVYGGSVQLDNTYDNAWKLDNGDYVVTNDPSFNPYAATGQNAQQLERTK